MCPGFFFFNVKNVKKYVVWRKKLNILSQIYVSNFVISLGLSWGRFKIYRFCPGGWGEWGLGTFLFCCLFWLSFSKIKNKPPSLLLPQPPVLPVIISSKMFNLHMKIPCDSKLLHFFYYYFHGKRSKYAKFNHFLFI